MGYSFSQAYVVNSAAGWVVLFGNGYDSQNGEAVLYALRINTRRCLVSPTPTKIRTYAGDAGPNCNGLSTPALIDVNLDGLVDFAFAGDLLGNMWKFDLRDSSTSNWKVAYKKLPTNSGCRSRCSRPKMRRFPAAHYHTAGCYASLSWRVVTAISFSLEPVATSGSTTLPIPRRSDHLRYLGLGLKHWENLNSVAYSAAKEIRPTNTWVSSTQPATQQPGGQPRSFPRPIRPSM